MRLDGERGDGETMDLQTFITKARWTRASNYSGPDMSDWLRGPSQGRDSDVLTQSNFVSALEALGGEVEGSVEVHRFGCWAGGWFEQIFVLATDLKAVEKLKSIHEALEKYPVLDEDDFYSREAEKRDEDFEFYKQDFCANVLEFCGIEKTDPDFASLVNDPDVLSVASALFSDASSYYGSDDAFVYADSIDQFACLYNLESMSESNPCAELVLACMGELKAVQGE